jgi:hypothetical protein
VLCLLQTAERSWLDLVCDMSGTKIWGLMMGYGWPFMCCMCVCFMIEDTIDVTGVSGLVVP